MPFFCKSGDEYICSLDLTTTQWEDLKLSVLGGDTHLALPCCNAGPSLRSGISKRQHFAHLPGQACQNDTWSDYTGKSQRRNPNCETLDHRRIKEIVHETAKQAGWESCIEYEGRTTSGEVWRADVCAMKDDMKIAFEVQLSPQQFTEYRLRQQRYREAGIKCLWLSGKIPELSDEEVPIFGLCKPEGVYAVDFPKFFSPSLLNLPDHFLGFSLGGFIYLLLKREVLWQNNWVAKQDDLASSRAVQKIRYSQQRRGELHKNKQPTSHSSLNPDHAPGAKTGGVPGIELPIRFDPLSSHRYLVIFWAQDGTLINYWFRGDLTALSVSVPAELSKRPNGCYAEIRDALSKSLLTTVKAPPKSGPTPVPEPELNEPPQLPLFSTDASNCLKNIENRRT